MNFDLEKLVNAYGGDLEWFEEIIMQIKQNEKEQELTEEQKDIISRAFGLLDVLESMNYVIIETETDKYMDKYYIATHEIYAEMKYDLTTLLGINEFWEMIN